MSAVVFAHLHTPETRTKANSRNQGRRYRREPETLDKIIANGTVLRDPEDRHIATLAPPAWSRLDCCPRCGQLLQEEPAQYYCRLGCTRVFPKFGGSLTLQFAYERAMGFVD